jgi:hypothetical protein
VVAVEEAGGATLPAGDAEGVGEALVQETNIVIVSAAITRIVIRLTNLFIAYPSLLFLA